MGDTAESGQMNKYKGVIENNTLPGTYIHSLRIGDNDIQDNINTYLMPCDEQVMFHFYWS